MLSEDELFDVTIPCQVVPGSVHHLNARPKDFMKQLLPGNVVQELELKVFDVYGSHVTKDSELSLNVDGFCFQQKTNRTQDSLGGKSKIVMIGMFLYNLQLSMII